ncbi:hypothetical protein V6N11_054237 [Hibiscus sabdariffa]|uniref:Uncharacterized protein n=1 Tax=Hibiscus sabdariffa TaxID=183260 RepID=A0ABR2S456_9ROSI
MYSHYGNLGGGGGDQRNPKNIIGPPLPLPLPPFPQFPISDPEFDLIKHVNESLKQGVRILREHVDQRFDEINQRIDILHEHVTQDKQGPAIYTFVTLDNWSNDYLTFYDRHNWYGSSDFSLGVSPRSSENIKHLADPQTGDSKGAVAYTIRKNIKWVVAWSNMKDKGNKVYIDVVETNGRIDWGVYESLLDASSPRPDAVNKCCNMAVANIDPSSVTPFVKATLTAAP